MGHATPYRQSCGGYTVPAAKTSDQIIPGDAERPVLATIVLPSRFGFTISFFPGAPIPFCSGTASPWQIAEVANRAGGVTLEPIVLNGHLDQYAAETLRDQAIAILEAEGDAVFDFSEVDRMHTAALQVLLALEKDLEPTGRKVILRSVDGSLRDLFRISGTESYFQFADGVE